MADNRQKKSAACGPAREELVGCGGVFQAFVYDSFSGNVFKVSFIHNCWWITSPGVELQPMDDYFDDEDVAFNFLCEVGGKANALTLAKMFGKALEEPEVSVDVTLRQRMMTLERLGIGLDVKSESLTLELKILSNNSCTNRNGKYSALCHEVDNPCELLFDIDGFSSQHDAEMWVSYYFKTLKSLGIFITIYK